MTLAQPLGPSPPCNRRRAALAAAAATAAAAVAVAVAVATTLLPRTAMDHQTALPPAKRGPFPVGCVWRQAEAAGAARLEFSTPRGRWTPTPPPACTAAGVTRPWRRSRGGGEAAGGGAAPPTAVACTKAACVVEWGWLPSGGPSLHALGGTTTPTPLSRNLRLVPLAVADAAAFAAAAAPRVARGTTLLLDYAFYRHPGAIGHWAEAAVQVAAAVAEQEEEDGGGGVSQVIILHAPRAALTEWVRAALAAALGRADGLPSILVQVDAGAPAAQRGAPLEGDGGATSGWLLLQRALVPRDVFVGGARTFATPPAAAAWRAAFHAAAGVPLPPPRQLRSASRCAILVLRKSTDRRLLNEAALVDALMAFGTVSVAEWTEATPVAAQLAALARTDVVVAAHTSALAAVHLVAPRTVVVEVIHRHWGWGGLDASFRDAAAARGGGAVAHAAWRARRKEEAVPPPGRDGARFGHWTTAQCGTEACVEAATRGDVVVNVRAVAAIVAGAVQGRLPPWPEALKE